MSKGKLSIIGIIALVIASISSGHPGGLDANGGHRDRKNGGYHYHRGPNAGQSVGSSTPKVETPKYEPRAAVAEPSPEPSTPIVPSKAVAEKQGDIAVYFSPHGGCTEAICKAIGEAKKKVRIQAYSFTSAPVAKALIDAQKRGVEVIAVLDKSNRSDRYSSATFLKNQGAAVVIDASHQIAHNKIILIDDDVLITGSFNFSKNAEENNAENVLIIREHPEVFSRYAANFAEHFEHSKPYEGIAKPVSEKPEDKP